jgi:PTS system ascorbate-specific IIA component
MNFKEALLTHKSIRIGLHAGSWEEAVRLSAAPLIESGAIDARYVESIIGSTKANGPYYVLCPNIAMPHAKPDHVAKDGFSLITLDKPVAFPNGVEAVIFACMAVTGKDHTLAPALEQFANICSADNIVERLLGCKTEDAILAVIDAASVESA